MKPRAPIRRFDVFAEYNRLQGRRRGMDEAHARGYGLWVAKVVASGGSRHGGEPGGEPAAHDGGAAREHRGEQAHGEQAHGEQAHGEQAHGEQEWHSLGGEPQTDALFEREIVRRMGPEFYREVFAPAISAALDQGKRYEAIRDSIRREWKP